MSIDSPTPARQPPARRFAAAARYWEPRRIPYNLVLLAVTLLWFVLAWPRSRAVLAPLALVKLGGLAALANLCYSTAYLVEFAFAPTAAAGTVPRWRPVLWALGVAFGAALAFYWLVDEVLPDLGAPPATTSGGDTPAPVASAASAVESSTRASGAT